MYKVFAAVAPCLSLALSSILYAPAAFAEADWSPRPDWEWIVQGSSGEFYPTLDQACSAYMEELMPHGLENEWLSTVAGGFQHVFQLALTPAR